MKKVIYKLFWVWEFEKEEKWLNEMSAKGLHLDGVGFCKYIFEEGTPGDYQFKLEYLRRSASHPESVQYIHFLEDTGAEHIGNILKWAYFRKKSSEGVFDLYSDNESRISHLKRINRMLLAVLFINLYAVLYNSILLATIGGISETKLFIFINSTLCILVGYAMFRLKQKILRMKKEHLLYE